MVFAKLHVPSTPCLLYTSDRFGIYFHQFGQRVHQPAAYEYDVTVRGAVSIGRRLMDPLAELVKIDAKSIGGGQYQHDVDQTLLLSLIHI